MNFLDTLIVAFYLIGLFAWAIHVGLKETSEDFLVLSRRAPFILVTFSIISSWVGVGTTVATAASGYDTGISLGFTAAAGGCVGVIVAALFAPRLKAFGDRFQAHTIGDFFEIRYSRNSRLIASALILIIYTMLTAAQFVGLTMLLHVWTGLQFNLLVWFAAISTIIYTAFAGIKSDFYTDIIHFCVMIVVIFMILLPVTIHNVGGWQAFGRLPPSYFNVFAYGGLSFFIGGLIFGVGSIFVTMEIWQRVYASSTGSGARKALLFSVLIIIGFYLVSAVLGMAAHLINPNLPDRDQALFFLMARNLPTGILGLGIAGFMAVFISTVNSTIMVASATMTKDFYKGIFNRQADGHEILRFGRISTFICGLLGLIVAILYPNLVILTINSMFMLLILVPAIIGGFFWSRATSSGALASIVVGTAVMTIFLTVNVTTAFVPGFIASSFTFIFVSMRSEHSTEETLRLLGNKGQSGK